jgi:hypothetical protein
LKVGSSGWRKEGGVWRWLARGWGCCERRKQLGELGREVGC